MQNGPIQINLWQLVKSKLGSRGKYVPHWAVRPLERLICQDALNKLMSKLYPRRGAEFCRGILQDLEINLREAKTERMPQSPRAIFAFNHPLGGLDGISIIAWLTQFYGRTVRVVVNDLLMAVEPLTENFLPINKFGVQTRAYAGGIETALAGSDPVVLFPAGLVSRIQSNGEIADLEWRKSLVTRAIESKRPIVPMYFDGNNSRLFYRAARLRTRLGVKINMEQALLPREVLCSRGNTFTIVCGDSIDWQTLKGGASGREEAAQVRCATYALAADAASSKEVIWKTR